MLTSQPAGLAPVADDAMASSASGVSWAAIFAGGVTASAISIILLLFGTGLGLASISPWQNTGVSAAGFTALAAIWLIIAQWVSALFGGYMAGRLRTKWVGVHSDEVFFRDTAHGFLAWAVATIIVVGVLVSVSTATISSGGKAAMAAAQAATQNSYYVDLLFRQNANPAGATALGGDNTTATAVPAMSDQDMRAEATTILAQGLSSGGVSPADNAYLAQMVSAHTGLAPADAQARVNDTLNQEQAAVTKVKQAADAARKASAELAIYSFVSLLIGAFIASVAGAIGGRLRDTY